MESFIVNVSKPKFECKLNHKELKLIGNVTLKVLEKLQCFEYEHIDLSEAEMGIDEEKWEVCLGWSHHGPVYGRSGWRKVEVLTRLLEQINAESRIMPEEMRRQLIDRKVFANKNRAAAISLLQHACTLKRCVILHNYASNNSGQVSDRHVEAYDVHPEDGLVICYDLDKNATRVFNINRIGYVEILEDQLWKNAALHQEIPVDIFHMTGTDSIHIMLQLDLMAKNLLVEEYPRVKDYITPHKGDNNIWYLSTDVRRLEGIGRFYIGLANHIQILEGDALRQYAAEYAKKFL